MNQVSQIEPHSVEAEQCILGALLCNNDNLHRVSSIISADSFHDPIHAEIYKCITGRIRKDHLADVVTVAEALENLEGLKELGGSSYLVNLAGVAPASATLGSYAEMVADLEAKRALLASMKEAQAEISLGEADAAAIAGGLEAKLIAREYGPRKGLVSFKEAVLSAAEDAVEAHNRDGVAGASTGISSLDQLLGGLFPGDFVIIGGRPSMGKTALALSIGLGQARAGGGVAIASLEMTAASLAMRAVSEATAQAGAGVAYTDIRKGVAGAHNVDTFVRLAEDVASLPIQIIPPEMRDIGAIYAGAKRAKKIFEAQGRELKILIVDYLQLIRSAKQSRFDQISEISMALKGLAMQLQIPVVALSQLSRGVESRDNKRPIMSDLRESGQIEQDADAILFCYRGEYYLEREKPEADEAEDMADWLAEMNKCKGIMEIIVAKQRMGETATVPVNFNPAFNIVTEDVF